jgi:DNA-binding PadR family transcriptional regulator
MTQKHYVGNLSPQFALLGLLYGGPRHGYDLHRKLTTDLGQVWHLSQSQAYAILKRLELNGDIDVEEIPQDKLPPRQLMRLTVTGENRFLEWLETPSGGSIRAIRMEFTTRLYFMRLYAPQKIQTLIETQRSETEKHIKQLEKSIETLSAEDIFNRMSLDLRIKQLKLVLGWFQDYSTLFQRASEVKD